MAQSPFDFLMRCRKIEIFVYNLYVLNVGCYLKDLKPVLDTYSGYGCYLLKLSGDGGGGGGAASTSALENQRKTTELQPGKRWQASRRRWEVGCTSNFLLSVFCPLSAVGANLSSQQLRNCDPFSSLCVDLIRAPSGHSSPHLQFAFDSSLSLFIYQLGL